MQDNSSKDGLDLPVDKGWEQMKLQLDEAMPQRRRRFFWWWFPLLLLVGFVVSYAWSQLDFTLPAEEGDRQERLEAKQSEPVATDLDVSQLGEETVVESQGEQSGVEAGLPSQENPVAIAPAEASQSQYEPKLLLEAEENQMVQITEAETGSVETLTNKKKPPTLSVIAGERVARSNSRSGNGAGRVFSPDPDQRPKRRAHRILPAILCFGERSPRICSKVPRSPRTTHRDSTVRARSLASRAGLGF